MDKMMILTRLIDTDYDKNTNKNKNKDNTQISAI